MARNKGQKKGRPTGQKGKKANKTSNRVDTPSSNSESSNTDKVKTTNRAQDWGLVDRLDWLKRRSNQQAQKIDGTATADHASGVRNVKAKNPSRAQHWDSDNVFAPSAIRQHEWKLEQHYAAYKTDATAPKCGSASNGVNSLATTRLPPYPVVSLSANDKRSSITNKSKPRMAPSGNCQCFLRPWLSPRVVAGDSELINLFR
jgi:hypothetical protein